MLEINSGSIAIDGIDLATIPRETIRTRLITITQDPLILIGTVRLNLDPSLVHSDEAIIAALERVGVLSVIQQRGGLDAEITASSLSRGQQQLLALGRALLNRGKVLLLDEPTSHVDPETNAVIQSILKEEFEDCTVLVVTHKLDDVMEMDLVIVMEEGRTVEIGEPAELSRGIGQFASLINAINTVDLPIESCMVREA